MTTEIKSGVIFCYPDTAKLLKRKDGNVLLSLVALSNLDSIENYEEVDELWSRDPIVDPTEESEEAVVIEPDQDGRITYEDAQRLIGTIDAMKSRIVSLQENNTMLTECILEMSEVIYNA